MKVDLGLIHLGVILGGDWVTWGSLPPKLETLFGIVGGLETFKVPMRMAFAGVQTEQWLQDAGYKADGGVVLVASADASRST